MNTYIITGRRCYHVEDTCLVIVAEDQSEAEDKFAEEVLDGNFGRFSTFLEWHENYGNHEDTEAVFINACHWIEGEVKVHGGLSA